MHIVLGLLGSIVTILFLLDRVGIDLGGLNPFHWYRRRAYAKTYGSDPVYSIEDPVHVAALMIIGAAKLDGDLTAEQKQVAKDLFVSEFSLSPKEASELFGSAAHLLAAPQLIDGQLRKLAARNTERFSPDQATSMVDMMSKVASADGGLSSVQKDYIDTVRSQFIPDQRSKGTWG